MGCSQKREVPIPTATNDEGINPTMEFFWALRRLIFRLEAKIRTYLMLKLVLVQKLNAYKEDH